MFSSWNPCETGCPSLTMSPDNWGKVSSRLETTQRGAGAQIVSQLLNEKLTPKTDFTTLVQPKQETQAIIIENSHKVAP